jgi:peptidoglycan LD-endopeptidase LytH
MLKKTIICIICLLIVGLLIPQTATIPVKNATIKDWNMYSYWFYPWGKSGVHKGIDIFAKKGTPVLAATSGVVLFKGNISMGGNVVAVLGPKWRIHYYAHLNKQTTSAFKWVNVGDAIGEVGDTGNAVGKPPHLHYSIVTFVPNPAELTLEHQGWKRMFYVNPNHLFR